MSARGRATLRRVPPFLGISLLGHLILVAGLMATGALQSCLAVVSEPAEQEITLLSVDEEPIDVTMIEAKPLNPFAVPVSEEEEAKALETRLEEARKEEESRDMNGQVVEISKPEIEMRPDDADFLSEYDSKVERQTKGASGNEVATSRNPSLRPAVPGEPERPVEPKPPAEGKQGRGALSMRGGDGGGGDDRRASSGGIEEGFDPTGEEGILPRRGEGVGVDGTVRGKGAGEAGEPGEGEALPALGDLKPSEEVVRDVIGAGSSDYLKDIDDGAETLLNTKRFKYATFFNRVKKAVAQNWHPDTAYRLRDPTGQIYGQKNRLTVLKVSIHPDGRIRDILIEKPSGVEFLDDEAVSAFHAAEPFPNPPGGLVDPDSHLITFRFGFFFEITSAPSFKIFRYGN